MQLSRHFCHQFGYTCVGGRLTAPEKSVMSISEYFIHTPCIQLYFLESLLLTDVCNLVPVLNLVALGFDHNDDAAMDDVKKNLSENNMDFNQPKTGMLIAYLNYMRCDEHLKIIKLFCGGWKITSVV
jgi:hypothetical protein